MNKPNYKAPEKSHATEELAGYTMQELHFWFPF
jgi:hypothetical protein